MGTHINLGKPYWIIVTSSKIHYGVLEKGQALSSSFEILTFASEDLRNEHLISLGVTMQDETEKIKDYKWLLKF